ncbi:MAG: CpsB/CapC family capsule biosynthesis tyrosine phosphatase [bacterium]|nr:CpsB/CapC family capsule biosynthesis tyrosine phosphatase [bacterium]
MIDLHAHLLPGVDDGPHDLAKAIALCRQASEDGITRACACPHAFNPRYHCRAADALAALTRLQDALRDEGIPLEVAQGMECLLVPDLAGRVERGEVLTLAGSRYLAVELPFESIPIFSRDVLFQVSLAGLVPVLVHPERNREIAGRPARLQPLVEQGVPTVVGAGSLTGAFGRRARDAAVELLRRGLAHGVATDAHDVLARPALLRPAMAAAADILGEERFQALMGGLAPAVWEDRPFHLPEPTI